MEQFDLNSTKQDKIPRNKFIPGGTRLVHRILLNIAERK